MQSAARSFFRLSDAQKSSLGDFKPIGETYAGYRHNRELSSEFLEMHVTQANTAFPALKVSTYHLCPSFLIRMRHNDGRVLS